MIHISGVIEGFVAAVTASTICLFLISLAHAMFGRVDAGIIFPIRETLWVVVTDIFTMPLFWVAIFLFSSVPSPLFIWMACRFQIRTVMFFVLSGGGVALIGSFAISFISPSLSWYADSPLPQPLSLWGAVKNSMIYFLPCGCFGGFVFWAKIGRRF